MWLEKLQSLLAMPWYDYCGYAGVALALCSLWMRTMIPLRLFAIAAGMFMTAYTYSHGAWPNVIVNLIALPVQALRLSEMMALTRRVREAASGDLSIDWLKPYMSARPIKAGQTLFTYGDPADAMFYVNSGRLKIVEFDTEIGPGEVVGEIGLFSPSHARTATIVAATDCELLEISDSSLKQLYYQNPKFGFYLVQLITRRLVDNIERMQKVAPAVTAKAA
jgi:CRP-like cAMP-binding protein